MAFKPLVVRVMTVVVVFVAAIQVAYGNNDCPSPIILPKVKDVHVNNKDCTAHGNCIKVTLSIISSFPFKVNWFLVTNNRRFTLVGEDREIDGRVIASARVKGNSKHLSLEIRDLNNTGKEDIQMLMAVEVPGCNTVGIFEDLASLEKRTIPYPIIERLPTAWHVTELHKKFERRFEVKFPKGTYKHGYGYVSIPLSREDGGWLKLTDKFLQANVSIATSNRTEGKWDYLSRTYTYEYGIDHSFEINSFLNIFRSPNSDYDVTLNFLCDTHTAYDTAPGIFVEGYQFRSSSIYSDEKGQRVRVIAFPKRTPSVDPLVACRVRTKDPVLIAVAELLNGNRVELLSPVTEPLTQPPLANAVYMLPRIPELGERKHYICSAGSENGVVSEYFDVVSFEPIVLQSNQGPYSEFYIKDSEEIVFTCNATGFPEPRIKFFLQNATLDMGSLMTQNMEMIHPVEITTSDAYQITTSNRNGVAEATLVVKSPRDLPFFSSSFGTEDISIYCQGKNEYDSAVVSLQVYPETSESGPMNFTIARMWGEY